VAYDAQAESIRLIEHGVAADPLRLSRRRRWAALAVDVDGDVACTLFTVRGAGHFRHETHLLLRRDGRWTVLGGGGGGQDTDGLEDRPGSAELGAVLRAEGGGSVLANADRLLPWGARHVYEATLLASREVHTVDVGGRELAVPRHGRLVVVWATRRPPTAVVRGAGGRVLGRVELSGPGGGHRRMPVVLPGDGV